MFQFDDAIILSRRTVTDATGVPYLKWPLKMASIAMDFAHEKVFKGFDIFFKCVGSKDLLNGHYMRFLYKNVAYVSVVSKLNLFS